MDESGEGASLLEHEGADLEFVEEASEITSIVASVTESEGAKAAFHQQRWKTIVSGGRGGGRAKW
eukprot:365823-Chlamydomonas_euryale.AAC.13